MLNINYQTDLYVPSEHTTVDRNFFNKKFKTIYDALAAMDAIVSSYGAAEQNLVSLGLARLNETLGPLLTILQSAAEMGFLVCKATGAAHSLVVSEAVGWVVTDGADLFAPTPYLLAQDDNDSTNWGILSVDEGGWTKESGDLATHVVYASKTQSSNEWTISSNSALLPAMQQMLTDTETAYTAVQSIKDDVDALWVLIQAVWEDIQEGPVTSVNGYTGVINLATDDIIGLSTALAGKASTGDLAAKQDASAKLDALNALSWSNNRIIYATGAGSLGTLPVTDFTKTLLDDADLSTILTTLGVSAFVRTIFDDADAAAVLTTLGIPDLAIDGGTF